MAAIAAPRPAPPPASNASAPAASMADHTAIQNVLSRYRQAFSELDVAGTTDIWPTVDQGRLQRAFDQVAEQSIQFDNCDVTIAAGALASAACKGTVRYIPEVGNRRQRVEPRQWQFNLSKLNQRWVINAVSSR
jgi:hypothetical protein